MQSGVENLSELQSVFSCVRHLTTSFPLIHNYFCFFFLFFLFFNKKRSGLPKPSLFLSFYELTKRTVTLLIPRPRELNSGTRRPDTSRTHPWHSWLLLRGSPPGKHSWTRRLPLPPPLGVSSMEEHRGTRRPPPTRDTETRSVYKKDIFYPYYYGLIVLEWGTPDRKSSDVCRHHISPLFGPNLSIETANSQRTGARSMN